jgi:L-fuconolactonase
MCKISGMTTEADMENWTRDDLRPYFDHVIECFGFDRVVYGGDWFVASLATTYPRFVETLDWAVAGCSDEELKKLYRDNAQKFYQI